MSSPAETKTEGSKGAGKYRSRESRSQVDQGSPPVLAHTSWMALLFGASVFLPVIRG